MHAIRFDPESLAVAVGDTVEWDNHDVVPHTSTEAPSGWASGNIAPDSSWSTVIAGAGELAYGCSYHPQMKAKIVAR
jgi:plastocyanin